MQLEVLKFVYDAAEACRCLQKFVQGCGKSEYEADDLLRSAVERQFTIIGEALHRAMELDPALVDRITDVRKIVAFRNILVHGYAQIEHETVWGIVQNDLPVLHREVEAVLAETSEDAP